MDNKYTIIYRSVGGDIAVMYYTTNILSCDEFRTFWVGLKENILIVGRGAQLFENEIMRFFGENVHYIQSLGLTDTKGGEVSYELFSLRGRWKNLLAITK